MRLLIFATCFGVILFLTSTCIAEDFPYREKYPEVTIIDLNELKSGYDSGNFIIIDVRSKTEFEAIHIKKAINLPYANAKFTDRLDEVARKNPIKKIAVYCNGIDCIKSYKAAEDAIYAMIPNVYAFDAGIAQWAQAYPSATLLQGDELKTHMEQLISEENFNRKNLDFDTFKKQAVSSNAVIIDARDPIQRKQKVPSLEKAMLIPVDKLVLNIISKGHMKDKQLYIFDQVGKQVKWVMYYLAEHGYTDFYFLEGGATAVLIEQDYRVAAIQ